MAWFGGDRLRNLTENLTGQISTVASTAASFTREVIAEGTEEVADQSTELQISEERNRRLETAVVALKAENERLGTINAELEEKAEASELQINSISSQYRSLLIEKEEQVNSLIQTQNDMEALHHTMMSTADGAMTTATSTTSLSGSAIMEDSHDFHDMISSQQEINRLSNEVGRLRAECSHWKQVASSQPGGGKPMFHIGDDLPTSDESTELKAKIKSLEEKLRCEEDQSQHELSALQDSHSHKLKTLAKKHKSDVDDYQRRIQSLEKMVGLGEKALSTSTTMTGDDQESAAGGVQKRVLELEGMLRETRQQLGQLEESNHQLEKENARLIDSDKESMRLVQTLKRKVDALEKDRSRREREGKEKEQAESKAAEQVASLKRENAELVQETEHLMKVVNRQETELAVLLGSHEQASAGSMLEDIHDAGRKFSTEEALRRTQLLKEKQAIVNQMIDVGQKMSDSKSTVATLEAATVAIADQAAEIVSDIGCSKHQEITADFVNSLEKENDLLKHQVSKLQTEVSELNHSCETLADDKHQCEDIIVSLNQRVKELSGGGSPIRESARQQSLTDQSRSDSEVTLEVTGESDLESAPYPLGDENGTPVRRHIAYHRPQSPSDSSVASEPSSSIRDGWTSETELSSEDAVTDDKHSMIENSDAVSFDGEYDDSLMFAGIKERFPEAADALKQQLDQFEMVRADWEMEKQALEEAVVRMREQLKEKDRIIQDMKAEKGLMAVHNENIEDLEDRVKSLEAANASLLEDKESAENQASATVEKLKTAEQEKNRTEASLSTLQQAIDDLQKDLAEFKSQHSEIEHDLQTRKERAERELNITREERDKLEEDLEQLDSEHQVSISQIISSRDSLLDDVKHKESQVQELKDKFAKLESEFDQALRDKTEFEEELELAREDLSTSRADLLDSEQMQQEQSVAMTTLRTNLQSTQDEYNSLMKDFHELKQAGAKGTVTVEQEITLKTAAEGDDVDEPSRESLQAQISELTAKLERLESLNTSDGSPDESVAYLEHELSRTHHEIEELNKSIDDREIRLQELAKFEREQKELTQRQQSEVGEVKAQNEKLREDVQSKDMELAKVQDELTRSQAELAELRLSVSQEANVKSEQKNQYEDLQKRCEELNKDLLARKELLETTLESKNDLERLVEEKEEDIKALAEENSHYLKNVQNSKDRFAELIGKTEEVDELQRQLEQTEIRIEQLDLELQEVNKMLSEKSSMDAEKMRTIYKLEDKVAMLTSELEEKDDLLEERSKDMSVEDNPVQMAVEEEIHQKATLDLAGKCETEEALVNELRNEVLSKDQELISVSEQLEATKQELINQGSRLSEAVQSVSMKDEELQRLQTQIVDLDKKEGVIQQLQSDLDVKNSIIADLQQEVDSSGRDMDSRVSSLNERVHEKELEISRLNESLQKYANERELCDNAIAEYQKQVEDLQRSNQQKDDEVNRLREEVRNITMQLQQPPEQHLQNGNMDNLDNSRNNEDVLIPSSPFNKSSSGMLHGQDGSISDNEKHLEKIIQEREKEIGVLQQERQSLLTNLNEKSTSTMGNSVLVDLHKNQMKVKTLESERHQMMTVLNEKTREASNLKNEVHKLLKVISAQKLALEKAQEDAKELEKAAKGSRDDMQKEALQNLSRIIQDKDLEIEALKQKNMSLLEVLQSEAPSNSSQISDVLSEKEQFQKENTLLKEEKDQLVVSIHQKHQESLAYYEEVQRLVGVVGSEMEKQNSLQQQNKDLQSQVEDLTESMNQSQLVRNDAMRVNESLEEELEDKQQLVSKLESQVQELNDSRTSLASRLKELEEACSSKELEISEKNREVSELKSNVDTVKITPVPIVEETIVKAETAPVQQSAPTLNYEQLLEEKDAKISDLRAQLKSQETTPKIQETSPQTEVESVDYNEKDTEIARLKEQLDSQGHALLEIDALVRERSSELERRKTEVATLRQQIDQQDQTVLERDAVVQKQGIELQRLQQDLRSKTEEAQTLRHHTHQLSTRSQAVEQELAKAIQEITNQQHMVHNKDGELRQFQDLMSRMGAEVREKDFQIGALQEKCKTLTKLVDERETDNQGEVRRLLGEAEAMQTQALRFQHERDQALLALEKCQGDMRLLQQETETRAGNEQKLTRELDRLRTHLLQMEEAYTQEALQGEEREKELRIRLSTAEEHIHSNSHAVQSASKEASAQLEGLREQLMAATEQKDQALMQLSMLQEESQEYILSLSNLQLVLEQFQREKDASIAAEVEVYQLRSDEKEKVAAELHRKNIELEERLSSAQEALDIASRLSEQLDKKEEALSRLKDEMYKKDEILDEFQKRFEEVSCTSESKVDKPLVKNLVMNYVAAPQGKKPEVMKLISSVLNFNQDDMQKVGLAGHSSGWLSGFFRPKPSLTPPVTPTKPANKSFTLQFVQFLENESTPKRSPRLPVDEMSQDRPHSAFNPFSAPVPHNSPFIQGASPAQKGPGAAHPFLKATGQPATPIGATQPVIAAAGMPTNALGGGATPAFAPVPSFAPIPAREGATPSRGSPKGQAAGLGVLLQ